MNKLTEEYIKSKVKNAEYTKLGNKTVICLITLGNNFEIVGAGSCVDEKNFDFEVGAKIAFDKALDKVWELEGYLLQEKLSNIELSDDSVLNENICR